MFTPLSPSSDIEERDLLQSKPAAINTPKPVATRVKGPSSPLAMVPKLASIVAINPPCDATTVEEEAAAAAVAAAAVCAAATALAAVAAISTVARTLRPWVTSPMFLASNTKAAEATSTAFIDRYTSRTNFIVSRLSSSTWVRVTAALAIPSKNPFSSDEFTIEAND